MDFSCNLMLDGEEGGMLTLSNGYENVVHLNLLKKDVDDLYKSMEEKVDYTFTQDDIIFKFCPTARKLIFVFYLEKKLRGKKRCCTVTLDNDDYREFLMNFIADYDLPSLRTEETRTESN